MSKIDLEIELKIALKPELTPLFLKTLTQAARIYGWQGDYVEVRRFVESCYEIAEIPQPDLNPFHWEELKVAEEALIAAMVANGDWSAAKDLERFLENSSGEVTPEHLAELVEESSQ